MAQFRRGEETVEAVQMAPSFAPLPGWFSAAVESGKLQLHPDPPAHFVLWDANGAARAHAGSWIVRDSQGRLSVVEGDAFAASFVEVR